MSRVPNDVDDSLEFFSINFGVRLREVKREAVRRPMWSSLSDPWGADTYQAAFDTRQVVNCDIPEDAWMHLYKLLKDMRDDEVIRSRYPQLQEAWHDYQMQKAMLKDWGSTWS